MQPQFNKEMNKPMIGISPKTEHRNLGFGEAFLNSFVYEKFVITSMIVGLYQLITGSGSDKCNIDKYSPKKQPESQSANIAIIVPAISVQNSPSAMPENAVMKYFFGACFK